MTHARATSNPNQPTLTTTPAYARHAAAFLPALAAISYPFFLRAFHIAVGAPGSGAPISIWAAVLSLAAAFAVPLVGMIFAAKMPGPASLRRLAYACVLAPTLYVFLGVVQALLNSPLSDEVVWCVLWIIIALVAGVAAQRQERQDKPVTSAVVGRWRVMHGIGGAIVLIYVLFHVVNHLFGLISPEAHASVMDLGRSVYRATVVEPILVALMLFQAVTGIRLVWRWSATRADFHRTFQVASGVYLAVYVIGHMNSVFIWARAYLGIPTDWAFATGAPTGLIHDAWNIRLLPHYLLGVFFVLAHLASGARVVLLAHGASRPVVDRAWMVAAILSAIVAIAILSGMSGLRIPV